MATNLKILLAEDNEVNQQLMLRILARIGYEATPAKNGIQALNLMDKQDFDVILMDVQMPQMDGITATKLIRSHYAAEKQPKIFALTGETSAEEKDNCLAAGMNGVLTKPIQIDELMAVLGDLKGETDQIIEDETYQNKSSSLNEFQIFDLKVIGDFMKLMEEDGQESGRHIIELYKKGTPELIDKIEKAYAQKNQDELLKLLHTLKGSCSQIGAKRMEQLCSRLEVLLKQSGIEPFGIFISGIKQEYDHLVTELDLFLASLC